MTSEKLQKVLARTGLGSRRSMEALIEAGRVAIDGRPAKLGDRVTAESRITIDNQLIRLINPQTQPIKALIYHKPVGEICSSRDPEGRTTVFSRLPKLKQGRWVMVGRLDVNTSGLLLFTNSGELANKLMHPSSNIEREYAVRVYGKVDPLVIRRLEKGVELEDGMAKFNTIQAMEGEGKNHWYRVILSEGRNRIVRRLWESQDIKVNRLIRVRFGPMQLPRALLPGNYEELIGDDLQLLTNYL